MITKISLKNIASYGNTPAVLETDKRINLVYGLNGTGKTTIANYLQDKDNSCFADCKLEGLSNEKVLVYNQKFIDQNFYESDIQKGIFTLSAENKEAEEKIEKAQEEINKLNLILKDEENKKGLEYDLVKSVSDLDKLTSTIQDKLWEIKDNYSGGDRVLEFCLDGKKSKERLSSYIGSISKPSQKPTTTVEDLKKDAATIGGDSILYDETTIQTIDGDLDNIGDQDILQQVIVGKENSTISALINELNHSNWVKQGLGYTTLPSTDKGLCPFCQQNTITTDLYKNIEEYFDETYQENVQKIQNLLDIYNKKHTELIRNKEFLLKIALVKIEEVKFNALYDALLTKIQTNIALIKSKQSDPTQKLSLELLKIEQSELNTFLNEIKAIMKEHNEKIENKEATKQKIIKSFWELMRWEYDQTLQNYSKQKINIETEKINIEQQISEIKTKKDNQLNIIKTAEGDTKTIQTAISNINKELEFFGLDGFSIVPADKISYKLQRPNENKTDFKTLSEGEKTVITFLYFIELCKGNGTDQNDTTSGEKKIIIIDDPISSLSHIYIFNVTQLIKKYFFLENSYSQIFILTHSLYFFHELVNITPKKKDNKFSFDGNLFRVLKKECSLINVLKQTEIQNDYQSYRQIIKDCTNDTNTAYIPTQALLANAMRNVLEYFFGFIGKNKLNDAMQEIDQERKYQFFISYMHRESHSDAVNISDTKEIDIELFKEAFEKIFQKANHIDHYNKMIS